MAAETAGDTVRTRMLRSAAELQRSTGVVGTGFSDIIAHSGAPRGSIYYHFPAGRTQLAIEATSFAAEEMADILRPILAEGSLHGALDRFVQMWIDLMDAGEFHVGCAVAAAAIESRSAPALRQAADEGFQLWQKLLAEAITGHGIDGPAAAELAAAVLAGVEGGIILSRAAGNAEPLRRVTVSLHKLVDVYAS